MLEIPNRIRLETIWGRNFCRGNLAGLGLTSSLSVLPKLDLRLHSRFAMTESD